MGSTQSVPATENAGEAARQPAPASSDSKRAKAKPPANESAYARAQRICRKKKRAYDGCYTAALSSKEEDCGGLFEAYRACFLRVMSTDMERRGVKVSENSMVGEYKEEVADDEDGER